MMHRLLILVALAISSALIPSPAHAQSAACGRHAGSPPVHREYAAFSGPWVKHGASLDVSVDGCANLEARTYNWCPPGQRGGRAGPTACDWMDGNLIRGGDWAAFELLVKDGQAASGRVLVATDPARHARPGIVLRLREDGHLGVELDGAERVFCRPWAWETNRCGS